MPGFAKNSRKTRLKQNNTSRQQLLANVELKLCDANILKEEIRQRISTDK